MGIVYLVGAGPGDPELITVRGLRLLRQADVLVHDRLVDRRLVHMARPDAEVVNVGKARGSHTMSQEKISTLLVARASEGKRVVRLKGGDPYIFGRGGEEAEALAQAGIPFEVVPGVTSAIAAPSYAGMPLTHRSISSFVTVVSGTDDSATGKVSIPWKRLASPQGTLVVLMAWEGLGRVTSSLMRAGLPKETPAALVRWGTEPYQRVVVGTVGDIRERGVKEGLEPPVVLVVGEVVKLRERLAWFERRPLHGKRILVTRAQEQAAALSELLEEAGGEAVEVPTIEIRPLKRNAALDRALEDLSRFQWLVFTSVNGVEVFFQRLAQHGKDARALAGVRLGAVGPATDGALRQHGLKADLVPEVFTSAAVAEAFRGRISPGTVVLLPRAEAGTAVLRQALTGLEARVEEVPLYRTAVPRGTAGMLREALARGADAITFTSSSTVRNVVALLKKDGLSLGRVAVACIGPVTAETAQGLGLRVDVVPKEHTIAGLVQAVVGYFQGGV